MLDANTVNWYYPVGAVSYNHRTQTTITLRSNQSPPRKKNSIGNRESIWSMSRSSLRRLLFLTVNTKSTFQSLLTLTFLSPPLTREAKSKLNRFLIYLQRRLRMELRYIWFMEFQRRGSVHFHILLNVKREKTLHTFIAELWASLAEPLNCSYTSLIGKPRVLQSQDSVRSQHQRPETWQNLRKLKAAQRYVAKYALKKEQKNPPAWLGMTGRFWGSDRQTGKIDWGEFETWAISDDGLRDFLMAQGSQTCNLAIIPKYNFKF